MRFGTLRIGQKLVLALVITLILAFLVAGLVILRVAESNASKTAEEFSGTVNGQVLGTVESFAKELEITSDRLLGAVRLGYPDAFRRDDNERIRVGERDTPALYNGTTVVNNESAYLDRFLVEAKTAATLFVRDRDDFVRVTTSLKKEDGSRAVGTVLDRGHPAYARLKAGESFHGVARLFGREYYTRYQPIVEGGEMLGVLFVGVDLSENLAKLKERLRSVRIGETGYVFVLDGRAGTPEYGQFVVHPSLEGKSGLEVKDENGRFFIKEMLEEKSGVIHYLWKGKAAAASEAVLRFAPFEPFNWVIASRADKAELSRGVIAVERVVLVAGGVLLLLLPLLIYLVVRRVVTRPLDELQHFCSEVEQRRDLTLNLAVRSEDEVGQTVGAVQRLMQTLRSAFGEILARIEDLDAAARQLSSAAQDTAANSGKASDAASDMAASVEELSVGISQISDSAGEAAKLSHAAGEDSRNGGAIILRATSEMSAIVGTMQATSAALGALGEESKHISGIVAVIKDVAEQTNLLALNAAIEAARAGEQGRGFAVVADEVRKLAERTTRATDEIARMTGAIDTRAREAVQAMTEAMGQVEEGAALATEAGTAINGIQSGAERVVAVVRQITESLAESSAASQSMANMTEKVAQVAEESNHAAQQSRQSAEDVVRLGEEVRSTVGQFRIQG
jgi:methyl-accepting chemotaxis protein-2 (aspartate sensor receptor)